MSMCQRLLGYTRERLRHLKIVHLLHKSDVSRQEEHSSGVNLFSVLHVTVGDTEVGFLSTCDGDKSFFISQNTEKCIKTNVHGWD